MRTLTDYREYYDLEGYLFGKVKDDFHERGFLDAFDLFSIVVWKSNRSKSYFARRLIGQSGTNDLEQAAQQLTEGIASQPNARERLRYVCSREPWGFSLAMGSAILTVLYPEEFTIYDTRVCGQLTEYGNFSRLKNLTNFDNLWEGYQDFMCAVKQETPNGLSLRDKDRYLWGKSFHDQLKSDIARRFRRAPTEEQGVAHVRP